MPRAGRGHSHGISRRRAATRGPPAPPAAHPSAFPLGCAPRHQGAGLRGRSAQGHVGAHRACPFPLRGQSLPGSSLSFLVCKMCTPQAGAHLAAGEEQERGLGPRRTQSLTSAPLSSSAPGLFAGRTAGGEAVRGQHVCFVLLERISGWGAAPPTLTSPLSPFELIL